jgi:hypothetical protein
MGPQPTQGGPQGPPGMPQPMGAGAPQMGPMPQAPSQPPSLMQQGSVGPFSQVNKPAPLPGNAPGYQESGPTGPAPENFGGPLGPMQIAGRMQNIPKQFINGPGQQGQFGGAPGV